MEDILKNKLIDALDGDVARYDWAIDILNIVSRDKDGPRKIRDFIKNYNFLKALNWLTFLGIFVILLTKGLSLLGVFSFAMMVPMLVVGGICVASMISLILVTVNFLNYCNAVVGVRTEQGFYDFLLIILVLDKATNLFRE